METLLKKIFIITLALLCITAIKAQVANHQSKIRDYKFRHDLMQRIKQNLHANTSAQKFGLKINPFWQDVNAPHIVNNSHVREVKITSVNNVWASVDYDSTFYAANSFLRTANGGKTWRQDSVDAPYGYGISGIAPVDANTCYAAMFNGLFIGGGVFKTSDGGNTWKQLEPGKLYGGEFSFPDIIHFFDAQHGVTIGDDDQVDTSRLEIYTTSDAGKTWQRVPDKNIPPTAGWAFSSNYNSYTVFQNRLWVTAGDTYGNSYIYRSDDFGQHWQQFPYTLATSIDGFAFTDEQNGLGVSFDFGIGPHEVETHDGGKTWADKSFSGYPMGLVIAAIPFTHTFVSAIFSPLTPVAGSSYSNDFGKTWKVIDTSSDFSPGALAFLNAFIGWAGRADSQDPDGGMYKWKYNFSLDNNDAAIATDNTIAISKNITACLAAYPNPASNGTTISFSLAQSQRVSLQVFDMSGRLIKKLANENMAAGSHQVIWNITDAKESIVPSGIYLLKFQTGNYLETKKISVIR